MQSDVTLIGLLLYHIIHDILMLSVRRHRCGGHDMRSFWSSASSIFLPVHKLYMVEFLEVFRKCQRLH